MTIQVTAYGIHWHKNVAYLHQGRAATNFAGLKEKTPFHVENPACGNFCNHLVPTAAPLPDRVHWEAFRPLMADPLVQAMLPVPKAPGDPGCYYLEDPQDELALHLILLSKLGSPIHRVVHPFWTMDLKKAQRELTATNILPLVLTQAVAKHTKDVDALAKLAVYEPRRLIVTGAKDVVVPKVMKRIETDIRRIPIADLAQLPIETLGAAVIRRYCRGEALDAPMESREARRERLVQERKDGQDFG